MTVTPNDTEYDVCVIGAGLSGLTAARELARIGHRVLVLEARDRLGGRGFTVHTNGGTAVDVGGQWVGPTQHRVLALLDELGIQTFKQHTSGANILDIDGEIKTFSGSIPKLNPATLIDLQRCIWKIERLAKKIKALSAQGRSKHDGITVAGWLNKHTFSKTTYTVLKLATHAVFASEPEELSFLFFLDYVHSAGGLMPLIEAENGAQDSRIIGGVGALAEALANRATQHGAQIVTNSPVTKVYAKSDQVRIVTSDSVYGCHRVIVAMSPRDANRIQWEPKLPVKRQRLMRDMPMGSVIKVVLTYQNPFWRQQGLSGEMICDQAPLRMCFDATPHHESPMPNSGALVGFILGDAARIWSNKSPEARAKAVKTQLTRYFGESAAQPVEYIEKDWCADEWTDGCYTSVMPAGMMTAYGETLRSPNNRIHWAGTETATEWSGYFDGAIQAGQRAAAEVVSLL